MWTRAGLTLVIPVTPAAAERILAHESPRLAPRAEEARVAQGPHVIVPMVPPVPRPVEVPLRISHMAQTNRDLIQRKVVHRTTPESARRPPKKPLWQAWG